VNSDSIEAKQRCNHAGAYFNKSMGGNLILRKLPTLPISPATQCRAVCDANRAAQKGGGGSAGDL
jgi:hypothetical protein